MRALPCAPLFCAMCLDELPPVPFPSGPQDSFNDYFGKMPWVALPYADRARKDALSSLFKVRPSLLHVLH